MKLLMIIILSLFLTGCKDGLAEAQPTLQSAYAQTLPTELPLLVTDEIPGENIEAEIEAENAEEEIIVMTHYEIYEIKGTAESITGSRWDNMTAWRDNATALAEQYRDLVFINMNPAEPVVYLTFDDGPDPRNTVSVINTLLKYGVSATFFFTGENMSKHPDVVQLAHDAGFPIGLHSYNHPRFTDLTQDELIEDLNKTNEILENITGSRSTMVRPPFGAMGHNEIYVINKEGLLIYLWSLDTLDWAQSEASEILRNVQEYLRPGEIILMHAFSGQARSAAILPEMIEYILSQGYEIKALP